MRKVLQVFIFGFILFNTGYTNAQVELRRISMEQYIETYSPLAVKEMERTGIPASIKMAQAILESGFGNSQLATTANNHFGIKCHVGWTGPSVRMDDDEANECFRKYRRVEDSFKDHSEFLTTRPRYSFLFDLSPKDYKNWARGLQRAGYATNPNYANLLIRLIEERNLHLLDSEGTTRLQASETDRSKTIEDYADQIFTFNNIKTVVAQAGETYFDIAMAHGVRLNRLLRYNDLSSDDEYSLNAGERVYLQPKRRRGNDRFHIVKDNEDMWSISQKQGIRLNRLLRRNRMDEGDEAATGERLVLRGRRHETPKLRTEEEVKQIQLTAEKAEEKIKDKPLAREERRPEIFISITEPDQTDKREVISSSVNEERVEAAAPETTVEDTESHIEEELEEVTMSDENLEDLVESQPGPRIPQDETQSSATSDEQKETVYHVVAAGETLFAISRKYDVPVNELQALNRLDGASISPGDRLVISKKAESAAEPQTQTQHQTQQSRPATETTTVTEKITHTVTAGETLFAISRKYNVSVENLNKWNNLSNNALSVGQRLVVGHKEVTSERTATPTQTNQDTNKYHTVERGETLFSISRKYNVTVNQIRQWNNLQSDNLSVGKQIRIKE
ncbi:MAG: LysM peptidoglycan-binding domain-containing protein [Chitinophagaceae bacterium]|nr:MAG: LysM peptidoglycan-binding domain-containing protein [Chitinophagaceae bacterium]